MVSSLFPSQLQNLTILTYTSPPIETMSKRRPTTYNIRGVEVKFPFRAYECQLIYMEKVIEALQEVQNKNPLHKNAFNIG
jgi:hypothetical protein